MPEVYKELYQTEGDALDEMTALFIHMCLFMYEHSLDLLRKFHFLSFHYIAQKPGPFLGPVHLTKSI